MEERQLLPVDAGLTTILGSLSTTTIISGEDPLSAPHFLVHEKKDSVGVVVVEGVKKGQMLTGWVMQGNKTIKVRSLKAIPIGHKIALTPIKTEDTVIKYGHDIGKCTAAVKKGGHVHTQNLKTKRW